MILKKHKPIPPYYGQDWHAWFAWHPVKTVDCDVVWLEWVLRQNLAGAHYNPKLYRYERPVEFGKRWQWQDMHITGMDLIRRHFPEVQQRLRQRAFGGST